MTKLIFAGIVLLSLTACQERKEPKPKSSELSEEVFSETQPVQKNDKHEILIDIPILEDEVPTVPTYVETEKTTNKSTKTEVKHASGGVITDGLDMGDIRVSHSPEKTRIVFDSYQNVGTKADVSGHYSFTYLPSKQRIELIVSGYRKFSALGSERIRTFSKSSIVQKIYLDEYLDDSGFKCIIDLRANAKVNIFDIKKPGRIVVDITPQ